ncbi:MAG: 2-polyprenyl-3-methyl-6-methoxy-1,4-benzoquinone monooxygenase [Pseudomonadales bacterium]
MSRQLSLIDKLVTNVDLAVRTLAPGAATAYRGTPAKGQDSSELDPDHKRHIAGLMRINHTGEVCAQALYQGQASTARLGEVRAAMEHAAEEEIDHLAWCEERIQQLGSQTSILNPLFYALSFGIGAAAGIAGDKWSLGFVAATEEQVCKHLREHLEQLPAEDHKTRAILEQMLIDEEAHATKALEAGGKDFPAPIKEIMTLASKAMTKTTYRV